ncbi:MAG TPA: MBL fold metallo-hydrolase [Steroidobacteraceae bacterium]
MLIDAGWGDADAADTSVARGMVEKGRDAKRIAAAARAAGVARIDYLLITHFHSDHAGGVPALAKLLPISTFIDHGSFLPQDRDFPGTLEMFDAYAKVRAGDRHVQPKLGDRLPLRGIEAIVVSTDGAVIAAPLRGAGTRNAECRPAAPQGLAPNENFRSTGVLLRFGRFRFLDVGDLSGQPLFDLATFAAFRPRVAVLNNGRNKGGFKVMFASLRQSHDVGDVWQLHWSRTGITKKYPPSPQANPPASRPPPA